MATDGPDPPPCDDKIFKKGRSIAALHGPSNAVERWVKAVAAQAKASVDWHYSGGIANVLHLGDQASWDRTIAAIKAQPPSPKVKVMQLYEMGAPGLYRRGVTPVPEGAVAGYMGEDGNAAFM